MCVGVFFNFFDEIEDLKYNYHEMVRTIAIIIKWYVCVGGWVFLYNDNEMVVWTVAFAQLQNFGAWVCAWIFLSLCNGMVCVRGLVRVFVQSQ